MSNESLSEARRQIQVCNACRYCEGYCAVFPAIQRQRSFANGEIIQLANLCHNCRGCYYACQYAEPHEFRINIPRTLAEVRQDSWETYIWPSGFAKLFQSSGVAIASLLTLTVTLFIAFISLRAGSPGGNFYSFVSHTTMVMIFTPVFLAPLIIGIVGVRHYWRVINGQPVQLKHLKQAIQDAASMRNLKGGKNQGCNYESADRFSHLRRRFHHATVLGFLLCFASTSSATVMHYLFNMQAPYGLFSVPKLLGLPGGMLLVIGCAGLACLKLNADRSLSAENRWGGEMAFVVLLGFSGLTGLLLYAASGTAALPLFLAFHLGCVLTLFLLLPYSKMVHGFFRLAALIRESQLKNS